ncbi:MAG: hypothetical protein ACYCYI_05615 [Saccharofermentanales bacterium]
MINMDYLNYKNVLISKEEKKKNAIRLFLGMLVVALILPVLFLLNSDFMTFYKETVYINADSSLYNLKSIEQNENLFWYYISNIDVYKNYQRSGLSFVNTIDDNAGIEIFPYLSKITIKKGSPYNINKVNTNPIKVVIRKNILGLVIPSNPAYSEVGFDINNGYSFIINEQSTSKSRESTKKGMEKITALFNIAGDRQALHQKLIDNGSIILSNKSANSFEQINNGNLFKAIITINPQEKGLVWMVIKDKANDKVLFNNINISMYVGWSSNINEKFYYKTVVKCPSKDTICQVYFISEKSSDPKIIYEFEHKF